MKRIDLVDADREPARPNRPLASVLDAKLSEPRVRRVWRGVERRIYTGPRRFEPAWLLFTAVVALGVYFLARPSPTFLGLEGGGVLAAERATEDLTLAFTDGSTIDLTRGAEILTTRNDARRMELTLERGVARFSVTPGGPRRWRIACGVADIEVVGTAFTLARSDEGLRVRVEHGLVRVRAYAGQSWALAAGEEVWVPAPTVASIEPPRVSDPAAREPPPTEAPLEPVAEPVEPEPVMDDVRSSEARENPDPIRDTHEVTRPEEPTASRLLALADEARLSGRPRDAVAPLERLLSAHPTSHEAPLAAVMLARLQQDVLGSPREAARALERAIAIGVPVSLTADVDGRLALAYLELGDARGDALARAYLAAHPEGARAEALRARLHP